MGPIEPRIYCSHLEYNHLRIQIDNMPSSSSIDDSVDWNKSISSILESSEIKQVKKLRKMVLLSLQLDESDKSSKKLFKKAIQNMEESGKVKLEADGTISLIKARINKKKRKSSSTNEEDEGKSKKKKKEKKEKKNKKTDHETSEIDDDKDSGNNSEDAADAISVENGGKETQDEDSAIKDQSKTSSSSSSEKNMPCKGNPQGVTRLFLGNLPFSVDESSLGAFFPGEVTHIKWITDKETGKFYGSAFIEMDNSTSAADPVAMAGSKLIGRPLKINFAEAREGDVWPPPKKVISGGSTTGGQAGGTGTKAMSAKPDDCLKLFIGNLSYDIDDEGIIKFFGTVDAEVKAVRWLHHKESGDFKGCGFVEFWKTEACEKGATLNGKNLLGRPIRIDWTD